MRRGYVAFVVSLILHGAVLGAFLLLPGGRAEKSYASIIREGSDAPPAMTAFEESEGTEIIRIPSTPPPPLATPAPPVQDTGPVPAIPSPDPAAVTTPAAEKQNEPRASSGTPSAQGGKPDGLPGGTDTTFFTVPVKGQTIVYLIDASASMGLHGELEAAAAELIRSVRRLRETIRFQVIVFNRSAFPLLVGSPDWLVPTPETVAAIEEALRKLPAEGGTDPSKALKHGLFRQPAMLFFLTDAGEFHQEATREITRFNRGRTIINVIALSTGHADEDDAALRALAHDNGGVFHIVPLSAQP
jgi:hypothetical protein